MGQLIFRVLTVFVASAFAGMRSCMGLTTNDVDAALSQGIFAGVACSEYEGALLRTFNMIDRDSPTSDVTAVRLFTCRKVMMLDVQTNMPRAASHLRMKAELVRRTIDWSRCTLPESDILGILADAASKGEVSTNDLASATVIARQRDRESGWDERGVGSSWNLPPNLRRWNVEKKRREQWNDAVAFYRRRMVLVAVGQLDALWKDITPDVRRARIRSVVESYGLTMPGP